jgi:hypothetical protein
VSHGIEAIRPLVRGKGAYYRRDIRGWTGTGRAWRGWESQNVKCVER